MSAPSLYNVTSREVSPVADMLKAVAEVNWHLDAAGELGWRTTLSITEDGRLAVCVERDDCWPTARAEAEAAAEGLS
jgi:hypothetical protein